MHEIAAVDTLAPEADLLDPEERFHRIREPGAAERLARCDAAAEVGLEALVRGGEDVPGERVLAPHAKRGRQAVLAGCSHRTDRDNKIGAARRFPRQMARERAGAAEGTHDTLGIESFGVDLGNERGELARRQLAHRRRHIEGGSRIVPLPCINRTIKHLLSFGRPMT